jgi:hypothetical protein
MQITFPNLISTKLLPFVAFIITSKLEKMALLIYLHNTFKHTVNKLRLNMCINDYNQKPKLDRQCTCNVKLSRVRLTFIFPRLS